MSAPEPDYDQLLSDHLDGRLDEADAQMLERSMRENPALQSQFDALVTDRQDLRAFFAAPQSAGSRLPSDFAARVLAESRRRGLQTQRAEVAAASVQAPLVERRPKPEAAPKRYRRSLVVGLIATAAAILLIVSISIRSGQVGIGDITLAQNQPSPSSAITPPSNTGPLPSPGSQRVAPSIEIASSSTEISAEARTPANVLGPASEPMIGAADRSGSSPEARPEFDHELKTPPPSLADVATMPAPAAPLDRSKSVSVGNDASLPSSSPFVGWMVVYEVRLSPQGRRDNVLDEAMRQVGLDDARRMPINRDVIAAAKQADTFDEETKFQVLFIEASAKKLDRLFLDLQRDRRSVEAVGMSLVTDAPLMRMANDLQRIDATHIKHEGPLDNEQETYGSDELATFRELLSDQNFLPITSNGPVPQPESLSTSGNDFTTPVLILVR